MRSVLVLGPTGWRAGFRALVPAEIARTLPAWWKRRGSPVPWPIDARALLVDDVRRVGHAATMMELWDRPKGELRTALFHRIAREAHVDTFVVYWPQGGHTEGMSWEFHGLIKDILDEQLQAEAIRIFPETSVLGLDGETGLATLGEPDRRTTYFQDLLDAGCPVAPWSTYEELRLFVRKHLSP